VALKAALCIVGDLDWVMGLPKRWNWRGAMAPWRVNAVRISAAES